MNEKTVNGYTIAPEANLSGANLRDANLRDANLRDADLRDADLRNANLRDADLRNADLRNANLYGANLRNANLCNANLRNANLRTANLRNANLRNADLYNADLCDADLRDADLRDAKEIPTLAAAQTLICAEGDIIGYKKLASGTICKLRIPADAQRSNATGRKCRAEYAVVLEGDGISQHDDHFVYRVGQTVRPTEPFDLDRWDECSVGIHFFLTRVEAEDY